MLYTLRLTKVGWHFLKVLMSRLVEALAVDAVCPQYAMLAYCAAATLVDTEK